MIVEEEKKPLKRQTRN